MPYSADDIITHTNKYRIEQGLAPLKPNTELTNAALERAKDMAHTQNFSHSIATTTPGMTEGWGFIRKAGYPAAATLGENLAVEFNNASDVMSAWRNSPSHNANITNKKYSDIGIAVVPGTYRGKQTYYVVQFFGSPNTPPVATPIKPSIKINQAKAETKKPTKRPSSDGVLLNYKATKPKPSMDMRMKTTTPHTI